MDLLGIRGSAKRTVKTALKQVKKSIKISKLKRLNKKIFKESTEMLNNVLSIDFTKQESKKSKGMSYIFKNNSRSNIRVMQGNVYSDNITQRKAYIKVQIHGVFYDVNGNPLKDGRGKASHIPADQFNYNNFKHLFK